MQGDIEKIIEEADTVDLQAFENLNMVLLSLIE